MDYLVNSIDEINFYSSLAFGLKCEHQVISNHLSFGSWASLVLVVHVLCCLLCVLFVTSLQQPVCGLAAVGIGPSGGLCCTSGSARSGHPLECISTGIARRLCSTISVDAMASSRAPDREIDALHGRGSSRSGHRNWRDDQSCHLSRQWEINSSHQVHHHQGSQLVVPLSH